MKSDVRSEVSRSLPKSISIPRLPATIRETPYPRSPVGGGSARHRLSDSQWSERELRLKSKETLMLALDAQRAEKQRAYLARAEQERKSDLESISRWKRELATERQRELNEKEKKRKARVLLEKEYKKLYQERVKLAVKEREEDEAHVRLMIRQTQEDLYRQNSIKQGFKRMFQQLIQHNEHQKTQAMIQYESELRRDAMMQRELAQKLAAQDEARERELKARVTKQQVFLLNGEAELIQASGKQRDQEMYRRVLDKQVRERQHRDYQAWSTAEKAQVL